MVAGRAHSVRRFALLAVGVAFATMAGAALTAGTALGVPMRDYNIAFGLMAIATLAAWPLLKRRRVTTMLILYTGILATATGFLLLYLKDDLKSGGLKDWMKWWHSATSVALLFAFFIHWLHNNPRLVGFTKRLFTRDWRAGFPVLAVWIGSLAIGAATWTATGRLRFTEENYLAISSWAIFLGVGIPYGLWLAFRAPTMRARLRDPDVRNRTRALIDTSLFLACWLAMLTGFALLYFKDFLHGNGFKYVSKWWHTSTSVLFVAFVVLHIGFNARLVAAHARRMDSDLGRGDAAPAPTLEGES